MSASSHPPSTLKPTHTLRPGRPRPYTLTLALPLSALALPTTLKQRTQLIGSLARAAAVFGADELVVFADEPTTASTRAAAELADKLFRYAETPPHLRRALFGWGEKGLAEAGSLPSLDIASHPRVGEWVVGLREGLVVEQGGGAEGVRGGRGGKSRWVEVGLDEPVQVDEALAVGERVTVQLAEGLDRQTGEKVCRIVDWSYPRERHGLYWGYRTRMAAKFSDVYVECPFEEGYDFTIGTSERGKPVHELLAQLSGAKGRFSASTVSQSTKAKHFLIAFGGPGGLEEAFKFDPELEHLQRTPGDAFDVYLNLLRQQHSRTVRTFEAIMIGLSKMEDLLARHESVSPIDMLTTVGS